MTIRIVGATLVPMPGSVISDGEIEISGSVISYIGRSRGPAGNGDLDAAGRIAMPGLVNGHTHSAMTLLRGYSDDVPLHVWLQHVRAFELRITAADIRAGLALAMVEMIRSGSVGFIDMFSWTASSLGDVVNAGMRVRASPGVFGYDAVSFPMAGEPTGAAVLDGIPALASEFAGEPRITVDYGLHAPYTCPPELVADVAARCVRDGLGVQIHLSETRREVLASLELHGVSPVAQVAALGLFEGCTHVAHAVHPEPGDIELLVRGGVTVSHSPVSNLKLGAGIAPIPEYVEAGLQLSLGTDSVASNNTLDLFEEIKMGTLIQRGVAQNPAVLAGAQMLSMATAGGAAALNQGLGGVLAVGAQADLILLDATGVTATPLTDPGSFLAYAARGTDVTDVFIAGRRVLAQGVLTTLDEETIRAEVTTRSARIRGEI